MKKLLIGTTALVAAGSLATGAQAADKIKMGVGGYFQALIAFADEDRGPGEPAQNRHSVHIEREGEIIFSGSTKLDNGIKVGAQVQLEAETCGDQIDETFIWFAGGFGRINIGQENSAAYLMHFASPSGGFGLNSPNFRLYAPGSNAAAGFATTRHTFTSDSEKITYFTPRIGGFQGGISYTPDNAESTSSYSGFGASNTGGAHHDVIEIGVNFVKKFGGVGVRLSGGFGTGTLEAAAGGVDDDRQEWNVGGQVSFGGFTLGAAWRTDDNGRSASNAEDHHATVGLTYGRGAWKVGVQWQYAQHEAGTGTASGRSNEYNGVEVGGSYTLGPGVRLVGGIQFHDLDDNSAATVAGDNEAVILYIGTALSL